MITNSEEFSLRLEEIQKGSTTSKMINPSTEPIVFIDSNGRLIDANNVLDQFVTVENDTNAETIYFAINRYFDDVDLSTKKILIKYQNSIGELYYDDAIDIHIETIDGIEKVVFGWKITQFATMVSGVLMIQIMIYSYNDDGYTFNYVFNTKIKEKIIFNGLNNR